MKDDPRRDRIKLTLLELAAAALHTLGCITDFVRERGLGIHWPKRIPRNQR